MKNNITQFCSIITVILLAIVINPNLSYGQNGDIMIKGKLVEPISDTPVELATVMLRDKKNDLMISGTTTNENGEFELQSKVEDFYIEVSFIGFETQTLKDVEIINGVADFGEIKFAENGVALDELVIRAEKSTTEFKLDKRVFNVGRDLSSTGASALEVLNNVPSVTVSIEGEIALRGNSGVQVLINGKPSVLASESGNALGTITADMIDNIEVITNPSAKYEAEGTSGIINIIIKKEEKKGINGSVTFNTGWPNNHSVGLSLNRRTEKFNLFAQLGAGYRTMPGVTENSNLDLLNNTKVLSNGANNKNENFYNFILGTDYIINKNNIITLSGSFSLEREWENSLTEFYYFESSQDLISSWERSESTTAINPKYQYEFQYKKDFENHKDHDLIFSALGSFFGKDQSSEYNNDASLGTLRFGDQNISSDFSTSDYTFKLDYTNPLTEKVKIETGAQYVINDVANDFEVSDFQDGVFVTNNNLTNIFDFNQKVFGLYATGSYESEKWGAKLGLRAENTELSTLLENTGEENNRNYTNLFPSFHTSYKLTEQLSFQAGYSRRIFRPRMWNLNPFFNIRNNFNIRAGNPNLLPEFSDSYELTGIYISGDLSLNFGVYHRYTIDVVERVTTFENNVSTSIPLNIGTKNTTGTEVNAKFTPLKWLSFNGDFNYNVFSRNGNFEETQFDFTGDQWSSRITSKLKLKKGLDIEVSGNYRSRVRTFQSLISDNTFMDLGVRKKVGKGRTILNLSIRDVFSSRFRESFTDQSGFEIYSWSQRGGRFVTFGLSYGFGKGEAMEFSGNRGRHY